MIITLSDIKNAFADLESGQKKREDIANFASQAMRANDNNSLLMEPCSDASRIWQAIIYLSGVDLRSSPAEYLHCVEDFIEFRRGIGLINFDDGMCGSDTRDGREN